MINLEDTPKRIAGHRRRTWQEHKTLPPDLQAIKDRLSELADRIAADRIKVLKRSDR